jgi:hypothetical protein
LVVEALDQQQTLLEQMVGHLYLAVFRPLGVVAVLVTTIMGLLEDQVVAVEDLTVVLTSGVTMLFFKGIEAAAEYLALIMPLVQEAGLSVMQIALLVQDMLEELVLE